MKQRRRPTAERRAELADAALVLLSREGAPALTVHRIAKAVGITDGAVFRHFSGKDALLDAAVERFAAQLPPFPDADLRAEERLGQFFIDRVTAVQARPEILGLAMNDRLQEVVGKKSARRIEDITRSSFAFVVECLVEAESAGGLLPGTNPQLVAFMVTGAMRGAAKFGMKPEEAWEETRRQLFRRKRKAKRA